MTVLNAIFESDELIIYSQPEQLTIKSDIGPRGERGSKIFSNVGHPDSRTVNSGGAYTINSETLLVNDMYYRVDSNAFYQWVMLPTGPVWQSRSGFNSVFKTKLDVEFVDGEASTEIELIDMWVDTGISDLLATNICVVVTPVFVDPCFVTITSKTLDSDVPRHLLLDFFGISVNPVTFVNGPLSDTIELDLVVSLI